MRGQQEEKERSPGKLSVRDRARTQVDHGGVGLGVSVWGGRARSGMWVGGWVDVEGGATVSMSVYVV